VAEERLEERHTRAAHRRGNHRAGAMSVDLVPTAALRADLQLLTTLDEAGACPHLRTVRSLCMSTSLCSRMSRNPEDAMAGRVQL
jgi:hypothetical protein